VDLVYCYNINNSYHIFNPKIYIERKNMEKILGYFHNKNRISAFCIGIFFLFVFFFALQSPVQAAVLFFSPASGSYNVGSNFSVGVYVLSSDQAINAVSGTVFFPQNLEITSLSKTGSILDTWIQDPSFSSTTADFSGIAFNPGFIGASGKIITINFKVKSAGTASLGFTSGSVLANNGIGTEVLSGLGTAQFNLSAAQVTPPPTNVTPPKVTVPPAQNNNVPAANTPLAPQISSPTNPDPSKWYNNNNPEFDWQLTPDIIAVRALYNKIPGSQPTVIYEPANSKININSNLNDGVYYFHLQLKNSAGWGPVSHFRFQIDTQPPQPFLINLVSGKQTDNPQPVLSFLTTDVLSGIDYYKIKINNAGFYVIPAGEIINNSYTLPVQPFGPKSVLVMAVDKAGNYTVAYAEFVISSINPPVITYYSQNLTNNEPLTIKGESYPNSQIVIWLQGENETAKSWTITSDTQGSFTFIVNEKFQNGINRIWAQVIDKRGARSANSSQVIMIEKQSAVFQITSWTNDNLTTFLLLVVLILLLTLLTIRICGRRIILAKVPRRQKH
jgi:hypothetical protein